MKNHFDWSLLLKIILQCRLDLTEVTDGMELTDKTDITDVTDITDGTDGTDVTDGTDGRGSDGYNGWEEGGIRKLKHFCYLCECKTRF